MGVALLFIDGVGIGENNPLENPLAHHSHLLSQFLDGSGSDLPNQGRLTRLETTFSVPGRPQSASNQAALFTGEPIPLMLGRHVLGFPNQAIRHLLFEKSIIRRMAQSGRSSQFANCFPGGYLDVLGIPRSSNSSADVVIPSHRAKKLKASASTLAMMAGNVPLKTLDEARRGNALTHDITGHHAIARGLDVPLRAPEEAAAIFWQVAHSHALTLFEHFLADEAGHLQNWDVAHQVLSTFDDFAREVVRLKSPEDVVLIISDHGNVENLNHRSHTLNPVALLSFGVEKERLKGLGNLADVGRLVLELLGEPS